MVKVVEVRGSLYTPFIEDDVNFVLNKLKDCFIIDIKYVVSAEGVSNALIIYKEEK